MNKLEKLAKKLIKTKYIENCSYYTDKDLAQLVAIISTQANQFWRLVLHENIEYDRTWFELDLQEWSDENISEKLTWLCYTR